MIAPIARTIAQIEKEIFLFFGIAIVPPCCHDLSTRLSAVFS
jgi:hypothetical protein